MGQEASTQSESVLAEGQLQSRLEIIIYVYFQNWHKKLLISYFPSLQELFCSISLEYGKLLIYILYLFIINAILKRGTFWSCSRVSTPHPPTCWVLSSHHLMHTFTYLCSWNSQMNSTINNVKNFQNILYSDMQKVNEALPNWDRNQVKTASLQMDLEQIKCIIYPIHP